MKEDYLLMARALRLAEKGMYTTTPNPRVGCVIVRDGNVIRDYRVVAPTEWNFHKAGPVAEGLAALTTDSRDVVLQQADLFLTLMDPCVRWSLELH